MKDEVIRLYLQGESRDDIARTCGVGEGTVSNIIDEWKRRLDIPDVQSLRDLAVNLKRCGIDAAQCAEGLRIINTMKKLGVNPNQFEFFMNETYEYCQRIGLAPQDIASNLQALINLSKDIPFSKMPERIEEKKKEKIQLEEEIRKLNEEIKSLKETKETLEMETSTAKDLRDAALQDEKKTTAKVRKCWNLLSELEKHGLDIYDEDISKIAKLIKNLREEYGFNVKEVISEFQDLQSLKLQLEYLPKRLEELLKRKLMLEQNCSTLENRISVHYQKLSLVDELISMGLGFNHLKLLCNTIREIAAENGKSYRVAIEQFFEWVEKLYGAIKLRQKIQEQEQLEYAKPDNNLTAIYPYYSAIKPFTAALPELSILEELERQRQQEQMRTSIYYSYTKINTKSKTREEEEKSNQSDNDNHDGDIYDG
jgi:DNA repair exonuclease SbcCD ATPase subunit